MPDLLISFGAGILTSAIILAVLWSVWLGRLDKLAAALNAVASSRRFVSVPFAGNKGRFGRCAEALLLLRELVAEADTLAAEQQALGEQQKTANEAQALYIREFERSVGGLSERIGGAADLLRVSGTTMARQANENLQRSAKTSEIAKTVDISVGTVANVAGRLEQLVENLGRQIEQAEQLSLNAVSTVEATDRSVADLADGAVRIRNVIGLIASIAGQSRLLALNAKIEANRDGGSGSGFGVVANEVKSLSDQTADATATITLDIDGINATVRDAVEALKSVSAAIHSIEKTTVNLSTMVVNERHSAVEIGQHAAEVAERVRSMSQNATDVAHSSSETHATASTLIEAANDLAMQSGSLRSAVTRFLENIDGGTIRVGVLHALSGTMASAERPLKDLLVMLVNDVNTAGGLLGRPLELSIVNTRSDWSRYASLAEKMLVEDRVSAIFGCWTSNSRKAVLPIVEKHDGLLFYPAQYEGEEFSENIYYAGATPNQQAIPAAEFLMSNAGGNFRRFALLGTDYVYPQITNAILSGYLRQRGVSDKDMMLELTPFGHQDWGAVVRRVRKFASGGPTAVISTINGDANIFFYRELKAQGVGSARLPVMAFSVGENEAASMDHGLLTGHYIAWNYFGCIETQENQRFRKRWMDYKQASSVITDDPMESTWIGFNMWCAAVEKAGTTQVSAVRDAMPGLKVLAPSGMEIVMDGTNHHLHKPAMIGRVGADGQISICFKSEGVIPPDPFSPFLVKSNDLRQSA